MVMFEIAIAVVIDTSVVDLVGCQCLHQLVISIDQATNPFIALYVQNVVKNTSAQVLAGFESLDDLWVLGWPLCFSIDQLQAVKKIGGCD